MARHDCLVGDAMTPTTRSGQNNELPFCRGCRARCVEPLRDGLCDECWKLYPTLREETRDRISDERLHDLKVWPHYFAALASGRKTFEVRKGDRGFREGDTLLLREWRPDTETYTGARIEASISYILYGGQFGVADGYMVLGLAHRAAEAQRPTWLPIETAPKDGTHVLTADASGRQHVARHFSGAAWYYAVTKRGVGVLWDPTHWMPLPAPPDGGKS